MQAVAPTARTSLLFRHAGAAAIDCWGAFFERQSWKTMCHAVVEAFVLAKAAMKNRVLEA